ncbi:uncharacterized protein LOC106367061 isoform X1 [Brassica napus]|uniref:uncharacterized protein LOC106367061 isoform X1 n=1 Tax=Brassica napus TaxID=3708 RepID=UPI002078A258|nr:uncharacterized protein LOC106367061 isoform X1 [Brassica napus]
MASKQGGKAKPLKQPKADKKEYDEHDMANLQKKKDEEKVSSFFSSEVCISCTRESHYFRGLGFLEEYKVPLWSYCQIYEH